MQIRIPMPMVSAPCRGCATAVLTDNPASAQCRPCSSFKPTCNVVRVSVDTVDDACPEASIPDPDCETCGGTGTIDRTLFCRKCGPGPCFPCVVARYVDEDRLARNTK